MSTATLDRASLRDRLDRVQSTSLIVGLAALFLCLALALFFPSTLLPSYLVGFLFWLGIALGCAALTMLHHLVGGRWGLMVRRPMEAGALTLIPIAVLFLPLLLGLSYLYPWAGPEAADDPLIQHKAAYLNTTAFTLRALIYFALWIGLALFLSRGSRRQEQSTDGTPKWWLETISGPGLLLVFVTGTFAAIDWAMSLEPHWYSSIYGPIVLIGWALATFAAMILVIARLRIFEPLASATDDDQWHDLGNLMLAFVMLWAYMSFAQFLIIYSGNLTEEIPWYLRRTRGGWQWVAIALLAFQFFLPFFLLLSRELKRNSQALATIALVVLVMHLVDTAWLVLPAHGDIHSPKIPWGQVLLVPLTVVAIGGICIASFAWFLKDNDLLPRNDPGIKPARGHSGGH